MGKSSSNYMRVCGKHFKKEDYIYNWVKYVHSILRLYFEMINSFICPSTVHSILRLYFETI
jgi:hypothetical protein